MAELPQAGIEEADAAIARASAALPAWKAIAPGERAAIMRAVALAVDGAREELARLQARKVGRPRREAGNVGKPLGGAGAEVGLVVDVFNYYAGAPERLLGDTIPVAGGVDMT